MKFLFGLVTLFFCARRCVMMILNSSERIMKKIEIFIWPCNSLFLRPAQRYDDFQQLILNSSESLAKPLVMAKLNMAYLSSLKKNSKTAVVLLAGVTISGTPCPRHFTVQFGAEALYDHVVQA